MATDPICGMTVNPENAAGKGEHNGQTYYFCSPHCLAKFKENPEKGVGVQRGGHTHNAAEHAHRELPSAQNLKPAKPDNRAGAYVCPMDPEVRESKPGACPKCGMALESDTVAVPEIRIEYVCPMHPEDRKTGAGLLPDLRDGPGNENGYSRGCAES